MPIAWITFVVGVVCGTGLGMLISHFSQRRGKNKPHLRQKAFRGSAAERLPLPPQREGRQLDTRTLEGSSEFIYEKKSGDTQHRLEIRGPWKLVGALVIICAIG